MDAPLAVPSSVAEVLDRLWQAGHGAYVVGGSVRDTLLGRPVHDWDVATAALPEDVCGLFPGGRYENRFGMVDVSSGPLEVQVTTFRRDHQYADHRRPDSVTFTDSIDEDLLRRDFTVNAIAWGRAIGADGAPEAASWVDPTAGFIDLRARVLRAVGQPSERFDEDGLRLLRAARFSAQLGFAIDPLTLAAMTENAQTVRWVSHERIGAELRRMVAADPPSVAFNVLAETGVLEPALPELAAQRGVPQNKIAGHDLWAHCLVALDAAAELDPPNQRLRLAVLLHDIGKPSTFADGHFVGHEIEGARLAEAVLARLAFGRREIEPITRLIANHMFNYEPRWSSAAVRRFVRRIGRDLVDDQLNLRAADNVGSGLAPEAGHVTELRRRIADELRTNPPLALRDLAVSGTDLVTSLDIPPGPKIGRLLEHLLTLVIADPVQNRREVLLAHAAGWREQDE